MNEDHLRILVESRGSDAGRKDWLKLRLFDNLRLDLADADLRGKDLSGIELFRADLRRVNLSGAVLTQADFTGADLSEANLEGAKLDGASLLGASLIKANLTNASLTGANLTKADLQGANLAETHLDGANLEAAKLTNTYCHAATFVNANLSAADLTQADLCYANLTEAKLGQAYLNRAILVDTNFARADLTGCSVFGAAVWKVNLAGAQQSDLIISDYREPVITVDNLEVAQFIYLLLHNEKIRDVIDTIGKKGVLILGRFTPERKVVLDALREELRRRNYLPMVFDFERPTDRDFSETIMTLAGLCRFIIADITNPKSSPLELQATVPNYMIPFVPVIQQGEQPFAMFKDLYGKYDWVLAPLNYETASDLVAALEKAVIEPALQKHRELTIRKAEALPARFTKDYI
jgi:uncharacterized protein YjbI with pentapeptide repeats